MNGDTPVIKILLIEDDKFIRKALQAGLSKAGFTILVASDGQEGLELLKKEKPNLVLLDLIMPLKTGFELLEDVRMGTEEIKKIPIIVMSNLGTNEDINKCKSLGAVDYFIKSDMPLSTVIEKVKYHLAKK